MGQAVKSDPFAVYGDGGKRIAIPAFKCQLRLVICNSSCVLTPTANRNSYRVARLVGALTQGSVLRPQPWAGESQLRQSCCCLRAAVYMYSFRCCSLRAAVCMYPLHCCCLRAAVYMYSFCCCYLRAALHMYSLRCCRLEGPGCVSQPPFIASIRG